jgi:hypothetical protein
MSFDDIAWMPLCAGVTAVGLVLAFLAFRRRGAGAGLRVTAWALLPMAAYLTGALQTLWRIGSAAVGFVAGLVLSPMVWAGVVLAGLSVVLWVVSGLIRGRAAGSARKSRKRAAEPAQGASRQAGAPSGPGGEGATRPLPSKPSRPAADDDFSDIEDILKRRGIG